MSSTEELAPASEDGERVRARLRWYQIMAVVTGCMLLLLCTEMVLKYIVHANGDLPVIGTWVAMVHGWVYMFYLICAFLLWSAAGWGPGRLIVMVCGGLVPFLSFVMEFVATRWVRREFPAQTASTPSAEAKDSAPLGEL